MDGQVYRGFKHKRNNKQVDNCHSWMEKDCIGSQVPQQTVVSEEEEEEEEEKKNMFVFIIATSKFFNSEYSVHIKYITLTFFDMLVLRISDTTTTQILYKNVGYKHKKFRLLGTKMKRKWPISVAIDRLWKFWITMQICRMLWCWMSSTSNSVGMPGLKELCYAAFTSQQFRETELLQLIHSHLLAKSHSHSLLTCWMHSTPACYLSVSNPSVIVTSATFCINKHSPLPELQLAIDEVMMWHCTIPVGSPTCHDRIHKIMKWLNTDFEKDFHDKHTVKNGQCKIAMVKATQSTDVFPVDTWEPGQCRQHSTSWTFWSSNHSMDKKLFFSPEHTDWFWGPQSLLFDG